MVWGPGVKHSGFPKLDRDFATSSLLTHFASSSSPLSLPLSFVAFTSIEVVFALTKNAHINWLPINAGHGCVLKCLWWLMWWLMEWMKKSSKPVWWWIYNNVRFFENFSCWCFFKSLTYFHKSSTARVYSCGWLVDLKIYFKMRSINLFVLWLSSPTSTSPQWDERRE